MRKIYIVLIPIFTLFLFLPHSIMGAERGIGVNPSEIIVPKDKVSALSLPITVKNLSAGPEWIEITFSGNLIGNALAEPGMMILDEGSSRIVRITFEDPKSVIERGEIRISASTTSPSGFSTGTGVKIAVIPENIIDKDPKTEALSASAVGSRNIMSTNFLSSAIIFLAALILLWQLARLCDEKILSKEK